MQVEYDRAKRDTTLRTRGLDMAQANKVFDGTTVTIEDDRKDYIISMRKANAREQALYGSRFRR